MSNADEAMSPAEFAKLMGAYPQPAENPLPAYGGYMDNSAANFAWVNNNDYFGADTVKDAGWKSLGTLNVGYSDGRETLILPLHAKLDITEADRKMLKEIGAAHANKGTNALNCFHCNPQGDNRQRHSVYVLKATKPTTMEVKDGSIGKFKKGDIITLGESCFRNKFPWKGGPEGQITPDVFSANEYCEECSYMEHDACPMIEGCPCCDNTRQGMMGAETFEARWDIKQGHADTAYLIIDNSASADPSHGGGLNTFKDAAKKTIDRLTKGVKKYVVIGMNGHYIGSPSGNYIQEFTDKEAAKKHIGEMKAYGLTHPFRVLLEPFDNEHGDYTFVFTDAKLNGRQMMSAESFNAEGTGRPYWIKKVRFQGNSEIANEKGGNPFHPTEGIFTSAAAANRDLQKMLEIAKNLPDIRIYIGNEYYSDYQQPIADASYRWRVLHEGTEHRTTHHGFSLYLPYGHYSIDYQVINKLGAEMDIVADGMAVVSNVRDDVVGVVEVIDDEDDDELVEISIQDENMEEIGSFTLDDGMILDDEDNYLAENTIVKEAKKRPVLTSLAAIAGTVLLWPHLKTSASKVFGADVATSTQEVLDNDPELIENPNTGDLDPAQYEELVVESTGYAVDVIPVGLDGGFMGSRFAALPTERYVRYSDPGIGAHTDIALDRDEIYLEPEMAMVQAAEGNVVKETQAPGQSPYNSTTGEENPDFDYRVLKETTVVSLDPAVKPFIPQSMAGYTGNANTPPSVYNKMFNVGVLGQTPAFVPGSGDIGSSHTGSRNAIPNSLGIAGSVGGPLSDKVNANYTDGTTSMSLAQWAIENTVSQNSDTEAVVIDRSSGAMKRVRRV